VIKILREAFRVVKGKKKNSLYILYYSTVMVDSFVVSQTMQDKAKLRHLRLGHISEKGLLKLEKENVLRYDRINGLEF